MVDKYSKVRCVTCGRSWGIDHGPDCSRHFHGPGVDAPDVDQQVRIDLAANGFPGILKPMRRMAKGLNGSPVNVD